jgi:hypothetical protein
MLADEALGLKSSDETTDSDLRTLLNAPEDDELSLVDDGVFEERQPERPIYKSIPLKAGVAAAAALVMLLPVMALFSGNLLSGTSAKKSIQTADNTGESDEEKARREAATENADLKRKLALQSQAFTATELDQAAQSSGPSQASQARSNQPAARPAATAQAPRQTYAASAVAPRPPAPTAARPVATRPAIAQRTPVAPPTPIPRFTQPSQEVVDLAAISEAGNYGQLPSRSRNVDSQPALLASSANSSPFASSGTIPISVSQAVEAVEVSDRKLRQMPKVMQDRPSAQESDSTASSAEEELFIALENSDAYESEMNLIMGNSAASDTQTAPLSLLPGSSALAEVTNALTWAADLPRAQGSLSLSSPLISDGFEVLPVGTEMIVQIDSLSESGAVALKPVAIVLPGSSEMTAINIPTDAISILAVEGGYPIARAEDSSERQLRNIDRQQAILGAMSGAGEFLTRPDSETSVVGLGGSSFSRDYGSGSIFGSILSGAANQMLQSRSNRLDEEADQLMERPTIWSIEQGRQLQLFITQEIHL